MRTGFRKAAIAVFALLGMGVAQAKAAGAAFDLTRAGSLYICPNDNLVNGQFSLLASECLQDGARSGSPQLRGGNAQGASNSSLERFWNDDLYLYNPISGAYTFLGAFMTPITFNHGGVAPFDNYGGESFDNYGGESPFQELPLDVKNLVRSLISHGDDVIDLVSQSDSSFFTFDGDGSTENLYLGQFAVAPNSVPETATWIMMLVEFGAMGAAIRVTRGKLAIHFLQQRLSWPSAST